MEQQLVDKLFNDGEVYFKSLPEATQFQSQMEDGGVETTVYYSYDSKSNRNGYMVGLAKEDKE